jgi:hypothetical protein
VGFEPTNGGFADLSLGPLGYRAELLIIAKIVGRVRAHHSCIFSRVPTIFSWEPPRDLFSPREGIALPLPVAWD